MEKRILIVDDEKELALILKEFFIAEGMMADVAFTGEEAYEKFKSFNPTLIILDIMLPDDDGMEICRNIRAQSTIPILMLSAKDADIDKILALGLGADKYLTKPYSPSVIVAEAKAMLRRYKQQETEQGNCVLQFLNFEMNAKTHTLSVYQQAIELVGKEFELLWFLASHRGEIFTKEQLYDAVWAEEYGEISTVAVHICKLRNKIEKNESKPEFIKTVWGVGYKFDA